MRRMFDAGTFAGSLPTNPGPLPTNLPSSTTEIGCNACGYTVRLPSCFWRPGPHMDARYFERWVAPFRTHFFVPFLSKHESVESDVPEVLLPPPPEDCVVSSCGHRLKSDGQELYTPAHTAKSKTARVICKRVQKASSGRASTSVGAGSRTVAFADAQAID